MCKVHVFVIISFFLSGKLIFLLKILKDLSNLHYKRKCETEIRNFFSLTFQWLQHDIYYAGGFKDPLKQDLALEFCRNQNKDFIVLTETHTNYDQIHHIRNNWLSPISTPPPTPTPPEDSHTKRLQVQFHLGLESVTEVDTDPRRRFVSFKITPSNKLSVFSISN